MSIKTLDPQIVWKNFYALTQIPRPSKKEALAVEYMYNWGKAHGLETIKDEVGNIVIRKPATPGLENLKGVILQGHIDMVPQKNADTVHDFEKDPIQTYIDGDWVKAKGTTLGADNGLGVAMGMAVLESDDLKHGPIELLVTIDEETGMTGANALKPGILQGDILINLDSETEGELYVGCAGGLDASAYATYTAAEPQEGWLCYSLAVKGFKGGHSGMDIILYRGNANKIAARILYALMTEADVKLLDLEGGTLRNAIPREAFATVYVPADKVELAQKVFQKAAAEIKAEYAGTDPDSEFIFKPYECAEGECCSHGEECKYVPEADAIRFIRAILACPDGVERMMIFAVGREAVTAWETARILEEKFQCSVGVVNVRFLKPFDEDLLRKYGAEMPVFTLEDHVMTGGLASIAAEVLCGSDKCRLRSFGWKADVPADHGSTAVLRENAGLTPGQLAEMIATELHREVQK